ncbi:MAG: aquaporin [Candidatus Poribacteria bacterium]|nr:aquaporin [Candidatus Poribacteria bacterium]
MSSKRMEYPIGAQAVCEYLGSLFLVMAAISPIILFNQVLDSGIALAVLADALAVGFILFALIEMFGPVSGAHFNPAVTLAMAIGGQMGWKRAPIYIFAQLAGGLTGTIFSHLMFYHKIPKLIVVSQVTRAGGNYFSEILCTFILVLAIFFLVQNQSNRISLVVGLLVGGQLIATSSTMFANPQVTFARIFTYAAAGVKPFDGMVFIVMEIIGAVLAVLTFKVVNGISGTEK